MSNVSETNIETVEEGSNPVTKNASPGDPMPKIDNTVPGQTGSAEDLGGPITKPTPNSEPSVGKLSLIHIRRCRRRLTCRSRWSPYH